MGIFDFFKKKKERSYDATNISLLDLEEGFVFEYDLSTWRVEKTYVYDWGGESFSKDHMITNGKEILYLSVVDDEEMEFAVCSKIKLSSLDGDVPSYVKLNEEPQSRISYMGETYSMESGLAGFIQSADEWEEMMFWDYYNPSGDKILCIEQFGENEFEVYVGIVIKEFEISNILPA